MSASNQESQSVSGNFTPVKANMNLANSQNWFMMLKFWGINIIVALVVVVVISIIVRLFVGIGASTGNDIGGIILGGLGGGLISIIPAVLVVVAGQMYVLNWFKQIEGCHVKTETQ